MCSSPSPPQAPAPVEPPPPPPQRDEEIEARTDMVQKKRRAQAMGSYSTTLGSTGTGSSKLGA
jgi:hypothetical protein